MRDRPTHIQVSLIDLTARNGTAQNVFRCSKDDKADIDLAAEKLHLSSAQFIRMVVVQAARKVLAEVIQ
jgi:uncharacterized protein (DUF1778 family)